MLFGLRGFGIYLARVWEWCAYCGPTRCHPLQALGSSAPEILLAIIEIVGGNFEAGALGPGTIVGSAAYNMLMITAICCTIAEVKKVEQVSVFYITSFFSVFAYIWLYLIVDQISPNEILVWEGVVTILFFPCMVGLALLADKGQVCGNRTGRLYGIDIE